MRHLIVFIFATLLSQPSVAQIKPSARTTETVQQHTQSFFHHLQKNNYAATREYFSEELRAMIPAAKWRSFREATFAQHGAVTSYHAHMLTYYPGDLTRAAVDFVGNTTEREGHVCGYLLWNVLSPNEVSLSRIEQNFVDPQLFRKMPVQQAAQTLVNWRCPKALIETMLGVTLP